MPDEDVNIQFWMEVFNNLLQEPAAIVLFFVANAYWIYQTIRNRQRLGAARNFYINTILLFIAVVIFPTAFIALTEALTLKSAQYGIVAQDDVNIIDDLFRWIGLYVVIGPLFLILTYRYSKFKATLVALAHLSIFLTGWLLKKWVGIFFMAVPILIIFYAFTYFLAQVIYPASTPNEREEKRNKFRALAWYIWGLQYPVWIAQSSAGRDIEKRISGNNFKRIGQPGIVWTHSHQVATTSFGIQFSKVVSPGISFLSPFETPVALVDLRTQLRTKTIEVFIQDGVSVRCVLFMSFKIDNSSWKNLDRIEEIHPLLRKAPVLRNGIEPDSNLNSSYPYSSARIQAALGATGVNNHDWLVNDSVDIHWDEIVIQRITEIARIVVSERTLNELWMPRNDNRDASALDEMAIAITERARPRLREIGVTLFTARVVNFIIPKDDPIREQLIHSWLAIFNQRIESVTLDGETDAEILRVKAHASAKDSFLQAINDRLRQARTLNPNFPKQVIALNFISTLQQILASPDPDALEKLATLRGISSRGH